MFQQVKKYKVKVTANLKGLKPNQKFGFHVHEFGNCENKALTAGAHLNPWKKKHGSPTDKEKHLGDLGNLESDSKGQVAYSALVRGKARKFFGRSLIVHALPDDLKSQPTGKSGDRIACGVIVAAMPPAPKVKEQKPEAASVKEKQAPSKAVEKITEPAEQKVSTKREAKPEVQKASTKETVKPDVQKASGVKPEIQKASTKETAKPEVQQASTKKEAKPEVQQAVQ